MIKNKIKAVILAGIIIGSSGMTVLAESDLQNNNKVEISQENIETKAKLTKEEEQIVKDFLINNDVDDYTISRLIDKLNRGEVWDCVKEEYKDIQPSYTQRFENVIIKKYEYPDGSVKVNEVVLPAQKNMMYSARSSFFNSIGGGDWHSGTGYRTCTGAKVSMKTGFVNASFLADFTIVNGGYDEIHEVYDEVIFVVGGTFSDVNLSINRPKETYNKPAQATLRFTYTAINGVSSTYGYIRLNLDDDNYYVTTT